MKKIIFLFGEAGSGRKTLIEKLLSNQDNIREQFGLEGKKIGVVRETIETYNGRDAAEERKENRGATIRNRIDDFVTSDEDVLLVKGQFSDLDDHYLNPMKYIAKTHPEIEIEFYHLDVPNRILLYERISSQEWFQKNLEKNQKRFPEEWMEIAVNHMKGLMDKYAQAGYSVRKIDTTEGYKMDQDVHKYTM